MFKYKSIVSRWPTNIKNWKLLTYHSDTRNKTLIWITRRRIPYNQQQKVRQDISAKEAAGFVKKTFVFVGVSYNGRTRKKTAHYKSASTTAASTT